MINNTFSNFYKNKKVLVTGHTGFKGSWLAIWLKNLGAEVTGYALAPYTDPSNFSITGLENKINSIIGDILDFSHLEKTIKESKPEIIFHLAAQPIVRESYKDPLTTYQTNLIGLVNLLEIAKKTDSVKAVLVITSDKCYLNKEWIWGYKETDELGGHDPYSASKACAEIITSSYRKSFFNENKKYLATARAGNVIGGGDWSKDRIIPDCVRGIISGQNIMIRNPNSLRPWQHVLEPLSGYLYLAYKLFNGGNNYADAWNFGPEQFETLNVLEVTRYFTGRWKGNYVISVDKEKLHEAGMLQLDCSKAYHKLNWRPVLSVAKALEYTVDWYKKYYDEKADPYELCVKQIGEYSQTAGGKKLAWTSNEN